MKLIHQAEKPVLAVLIVAAGIYSAFTSAADFVRRALFTSGAIP